MSELQKNVDALVKKAVTASESTDALRWSQAALNAAHTRAALGLPAPDGK